MLSEPIERMNAAGVQEAIELLKAFVPQVEEVAPAWHCVKQYIYTNVTGEAQRFKVTAGSLAGFEIGIEGSGPALATPVPNGGATTFAGILHSGARLYIHVLLTPQEARDLAINQGAPRPWSLVGWGPLNITAVAPPIPADPALAPPPAPRRRG